MHETAPMHDNINSMLAHLEGCIVARVQLYKRVDFINGVSQLEVSVCGGHFELCDQAVYFADEQADGQAFLTGLLDGLFSD